MEDSDPECDNVGNTTLSCFPQSNTTLVQDIWSKVSRFLPFSRGLPPPTRPLEEADWLFVRCAAVAVMKSLVHLERELPDVCGERSSGCVSVQRWVDADVGVEKKH